MFIKLKCYRNNVMFEFVTSVLKMHAFLKADVIDSAEQIQKETENK